MKAVGLITEYNPLHNGHLYHLQQAKALTDADVVVTVMSGNFVQRGEPALVDKWRRAQAAINNGIDVLFELPFYYAVQPAHIFARGAIRLLAAAGVETIVFGAEHADLDFLGLAEQASKALQQASHFSDFNETYATSFNQTILAATGVRIEGPNDMLGFAYAMAIVELDLVGRINVQPIQRIRAGYHSLTITDQTIASASAIREALQSKAIVELTDYLPASMGAGLVNGMQVQPWELGWFEFLRYKVLTTPVEELAKIYQLNDGLAYRIKKIMTVTIDWATFKDAFKSKRYTWSRLQRTLLYVLMNVSDIEMREAWDEPYLRLLGTSANGRMYLKAIRDTVELPIIHRVAKADVTGRMQLDVRAGRLYQQLSEPAGQEIMQDFKRQPLFSEGD